MPLYKIAVFKNCPTFGGESWENIYMYNTADLAGALANGVAVMNREKAVSYDTINFDGFTVYSAAGGVALAGNRGANGTGALASVGLGGILPLFNTVKATFYNPVGRPEIKYLRLGGNAANISNGAWDGDFIDAVDAGYTQPQNGDLEYVGPSGEFHIGAITSLPVQMRQLHWSRRSRAGFKRGWVPV